MKAHKSTKPKSGTQVRQEFAMRGESVASFARRHALSVATVRQVLNGHSRGCRGEAHRAAVLLGMKIGIIDSNVGH